jgi:hypothetical protein
LCTQELARGITGLLISVEDPGHLDHDASMAHGKSAILYVSNLWPFDWQILGEIRVISALPDKEMRDMTERKKAVESHPC